VPLPPLSQTGELPPGVHKATLVEVLDRFGGGTLRRRIAAQRLERIYHLALSTGHLVRFVVFGSFVTAKSEPNDVDVFLMMEDAFEFRHLTGLSCLLFDHPAAQAHLGASVFWLRRVAAMGGEEAAVEYWQARREGGLRGIVEIIEERS